MKRFFFLLVLFAFAHSVNSQKPSAIVKWSELMDFSESGFSHIISCNERYFTTMGFIRESGKYRITKYDMNTMTEMSRREYEKFEYKGTPAFHQYTYPFKGGYLLIFTAHDEEAEVKSIVLRWVDKSGEMGPPVGVADVSLGKNEKNYTNIHFSQDSSKILAFSYYPYEKKDKRGFKLSVLNGDLEELWKEDVQLPYAFNEIGLNNFYVSNDGEVFVTADAHSDSDLRKRTNDAYKVFKFPSKTARVEELRFSLKGSFATSGQLIPDFTPGKMIFTGGYADDFNGNLGGVFFMTVDQATFRAGVANLTPLEGEIEETLKEAAKVGFLSGELNAYEVGKALPNHAGGVTLLAQREYQRTYVNRETNKYEYTKYNRDEVAIFILGENGDVKEFSIIRKKQVAKEETDFLSYLLIDGGDRVHLVYNDSEKTVERLEKGKQPAEMYVIRNSTVTLATVKNDEEYYQTLYPNKEQQAFFVPYLSKSASPGHAVLVQIKGNKLKFGHLSIQ